MPEWLRWVLAGLATQRLVELIGLDDGPGDVFETIRERLGAYRLGPQLIPITKLGYLLRCPYCLGVYAALLCAVLCLWPTLPGDLFLGWVGLAGAQTLLQGLPTRRRGWLADKIEASAAKPKMRVKADGSVEEA